MIFGFRNRIWDFLKNVRGAILIEFAVCMPILILLLLGLHDIFRMARFQDQTNFVAHEIVQMIQNISQGRADKRITVWDLGSICRFAGYTIYPGTTLYCTAPPGNGWKHVYAHNPVVSFVYVKGESGGKASCIWRARWSSTYTRVGGGDMSTEAVWLGGSPGWGGDKNTCIVNLSDSPQLPSDIYPTLTIAEGETKIIVDVTILQGLNKYPDGTAPSSVKQAFGLYLLTPKEETQWCYFHSVAIFTPKRGLFDDAGPQ